MTAERGVRPAGGNKVRFNIGGTLFLTFDDTLKHFPESKLANLSTCRDNYDDDTREYFFDRNPVLFGFILDAYRKEEIHLPSDICGPTFRKELEFWELSLSHVAPCCWEALYKSDDDIKTVNKLMDNYKENASMCSELDNHNKWRKTLWLFLEDPNSSKFAMAWVSFISILVLASTAAEIMLTLPQFHEDFTESEMKTVDLVLDIYQFKNGTTELFKSMKPNVYLTTTIMCCQVILTAELILSFMVCPKKKSFACNFIRVSATLGYVGFWVAYVFDSHLVTMEDNAWVYVYIVCKYGVILRLARLFYLSKHIPTFNVVGLTFSSSMSEFKILVFLLGILVCVFGYMMFASEYFGNENMRTMLSAMYWALITLTTVGYGDIIPFSVAGQVIASVCAVCGVIVLALPIGIISSTFYKFYNFNSYATTHLRLTSSMLKKTREEKKGIACTT
ncbi:hypothetical protein ACF0H5_001687 [Mactra antiquata]